MPERYVNVDRETPMFLPPDLREWVADNDWVKLVLEVVQQTNLEVAATNERGSGSEQYPPGMMLALLIYCYAQGLFSSRQIERATYDSVAVRYLCANHHPDHDTIATFRRSNRRLFEQCFGSLLGVARELGLVRLGAIAIDGSRLGANASAQQFRTGAELQAQDQVLQQTLKELFEKAEAADQGEGESGGPQLPAELANEAQRRRKVQQALAELKRRQQAQEKNPERTGRKSRASTQPEVNLTDPEARKLHRRGGQMVTGYNAQVAVDLDSGGLIVGALVSNEPNDNALLEPVLDQIPAELGRPQEVVADSGYENGQAVAELESARPELTIYYPPQPTNKKPALQPTRRSARNQVRHRVRQQMQERAQSERGQELFLGRQIYCEGAFATIKRVLGFERFWLRGLDKVQNEWLLICTAFNLRKLAKI
jgi:transposase/IS5 family transposase